MDTLNSFNRNSIRRRIIASCALFAFLFNTVVIPIKPSYAQEALGLPAPGVMVDVSSQFVPAVLKGMKIYPANPLRFDFLIDTGNSTLKDSSLEQESTKLIRYFLASLTIPEDDLWVNLSPYEHDRIIPENFGLTEMGRDLLGADYILKQLTSSMMYPEKSIGSEVWKKIYARAYEKYGTTDIPFDTFNKVWIVPDEASVDVSGDTAFIVKSHLKVMLDTDYLAMKKNTEKSQDQDAVAEARNIAQQVIREIVLPEIEKDVNSGQNFSALRQIYHAMILATWFRRNLKESFLGKIYMGENKISGVDVDDKQIKEKIYNQYLKAFKKGVFNYIKEDYDAATQEVIPRKYFSGGMEFTAKAIDGALLVQHRSAQKTKAEVVKTTDGKLLTVSAVLDPVKNLDRLRRILNVLAQSDQVPQVPQGASEDVILEFVLSHLQAQGLIKEIREDSSDVKVVVIKDEVKESEIGKAVQRWVMQPRGGVRAINFKGIDGIWKIVSFESDINQQLDLEREEVKERKAGSHWIVAHNNARQRLRGGDQQIDQERARQDFEVARRDIVSASIDRVETPTTFEHYLSTPLLEHDKLIGEEIRFIFQLFGHIDFKFVPSDALLQKNSVTQNVYDESGQLKTILCNDKVTAENLIDILSTLRNLSPEGQWSWRPLAIRIYSYFHGWKEALNRYSMRSSTPETLRNELSNLETYFGKLAEKIDHMLELSGQIDAEAVSVESNVTRLIDRVLERAEAGVDIQQKQIERLELFFSSHLATYLTDQIDRVLIENVFDQFKQLTENWDVLSSRNEILIGIMGEEGSSKFSSWLELARQRFQKIQDENTGNPEKLRQLHLQFAKEIGNIIRTQFPEYSSGNYQLGRVADANKANCVGYATMFYLIAKEIGLNVAYTSVEYAGDKEIHHAANLLHLPSVSGEDSFVVVDVTWSNYISEPISEASISVQYKDGMMRRIAIPQAMSKHNVVVEYQDPLYGIQHAIYSWSSSSNEYLTNQNLKKRVVERMLRINPNDATALRLLGIYYASAKEDTYTMNNAIAYLKRSLKLKTDWFALHELKRIALKLGRTDDFYRFCEQVLSIHNSPNTCIVVANAIKLDNPRGNEVEIIHKTLGVLENGLKMFPENSNIMKELASVYMDLYTSASETSEKRRAYDMAIDYMERTLRKTSSDGQLLNKYWQLIRKEDAGSERFVAFCFEIMQANPQLAQPVSALMPHYEMQGNEEGYNKAISLAKEYLEKSESTDRRRILWSLKKIYTNMVYESDRRGNVYYGKIDDLLQYLNELLNKFPDSFATVQCIAETYMWAKRFDEAIPYLQRFLQKFPHNKECLEALIISQASVKDWQGVVKTADDMFDADSNNMTALKLQGTAYQELGQLGEAIKRFERFLALYGGYSDASDIRNRLAVCQERAKDVGGIDLNPNMLKLQTRGQVIDFSMPVDVQAIQSIDIDGFSPVIFQIIPTNLPMLMGERQ